jgi:hypothetical protein
MHKIMPCLWFNDKAEEAGSEASGRPKGTIMTVAFQTGIVWKTVASE